MVVAEGRLRSPIPEQAELWEKMNDRGSRMLFHLFRAVSREVPERLESEHGVSRGSRKIKPSRSLQEGICPIGFERQLGRYTSF